MTQYNAVQAGPWGSASTWGGSGYPTNSGDIGNVNGYAVTLNTNVSNNMTAEDLSSGGTGSLVVNSSQSITR